MVVEAKAVGLMEPFAAERPWAMVLAGGEGTRLQSLTRAIDGDSRPKQFSKIFGSQSLLGHTRERLQPVFDDDRVLFIVNQSHDRFYRHELANVERANVVEQPANRGTAVAIITSLLQLRQHKPDAIVGIFPSDHYYADNEAFGMTVKSAIKVSETHYDSIVMIGAKPQWPEIEYGWIEPGDGIANQYNSKIFRVNRFREKPPLHEARQLMHKGGLWNTFVAIGRAGAFLNLLAATVMPAMTRIADAVAHRDLGGVYGEIDSIDFSKDVLTHQSQSLLVMKDSLSGWADLGHPERVIATLDRHQIEPDWLCELRRTNSPRVEWPISPGHRIVPSFRKLVTVQ